MLPMIAHYKMLTDQHNLIEPLKELVMDGSSEDVLTPEHQYILKNADSIREQHKQTPVHLERLYSTLGFSPSTFFFERTARKTPLLFRYGRRSLH